ncbi:hypothetical protein TUM3811_35940 [Shewanella algae]|nr:hypothetical protein TUM3811_35940 [Shewanella algae]
MLRISLQIVIPGWVRTLQNTQLLFTEGFQAHSVWGSLFIRSEFGREKGMVEATDSLADKTAVGADDTVPADGDCP